MINIYTQFFGNFLLNKRFITIKQLTDALELQNNIRYKFGVIAKNYGYMTQEQIEHVLNKQKSVSDLFGNIAIKLGYLDNEKVEEIINCQNTSYLLLGQALLQKGYIKKDDLIKAINEYKSKFVNSCNRYFCIQNKQILEIIDRFFKLVHVENEDIIREYIYFFINNMGRLIGNDFTLGEIFTVESFICKNIIFQLVEGDFNIFTSIIASDDVLINIANRFNKSSDKDKKVGSVEKVEIAKELLNLNNSIYIISSTNLSRMELECIQPLSYKNMKLSEMKFAFCIPIKYNFGVINFVVSCNMPRIKCLIKG